MDARGGEILLTHLNDLDRHEGTTPWGDTPPAFVSERDRRSLVARGRIAGGSLKYLRTLAPVPPVSPGGRPLPPGRACFRRQSFVAPDSTDQRATREICWRVAVVGKAMAELARRRGTRRGAVPAADLGRRAPEGRAGRDLRQSPRVPLRAIPARRDRRTCPRWRGRFAVRWPRRSATGRSRPTRSRWSSCSTSRLSRMLRMLPWTTSGELFSFNCADLADWPNALAECFGRKVVNAYHVPVVPPRPGIGVFFNRCGGRNNLVVSWIEGVVSEAEADENSRGRFARQWDGRSRRDRTQRELGVCASPSSAPGPAGSALAICWRVRAPP